MINTLKLVSANGLMTVFTIKSGVHLKLFHCPDTLARFQQQEKKRLTTDFLCLIVVTAFHCWFPVTLSWNSINEAHFGHLRFNSCWNEEVILGNTLFNKR